MDQQPQADVDSAPIFTKVRRDDELACSRDAGVAAVTGCMFGSSSGRTSSISKGGADQVRKMETVKSSHKFIEHSLQHYAPRAHSVKLRLVHTSTGDNGSESYGWMYICLRVHGRLWIL